MTRAYGFNPQKSEQGLWSTDPIWQADVSEVQLMNKNTSIHYLHTDHLGTPVLGTSRLGESTWKSVAEAFGAAGALPKNHVQMNLRFPGSYWDEESGMHQNFHRDYRPQVGRYIQIDPIGLWGGLNFFDYADANPLRKIDYLGLSSNDTNCDDKCTADPELDISCFTQCGDQGSCQKCCHAQARKLAAEGTNPAKIGLRFILECTKTCALRSAPPQQTGPAPEPPKKPWWCELFPKLCKLPSPGK